MKSGQEKCAESDGFLAQLTHIDKSFGWAGLLVGPSGSGKTRWLKEHCPEAVWVAFSPQEKDLVGKKAWRLGHLFGLDELFRYFIDSRLQWCCPGCGQMRRQGPLSGLSERLKEGFESKVYLGFPYSGPREVLVDKGYWRIMTQNGIEPLPAESWIEADILVDRLDMVNVEAVRLQESVEQCLLAGLGEIVVRDLERRIVCGPALRCDACGLDGALPKLSELSAWIQGKKEKDEHWKTFYWEGMNLFDLLHWNAGEWRSLSGQKKPEPWWSFWEMRMQRVIDLDLGHIPLDRCLGGLSSGERALAMVGRCLEWSLSGYEFIFEHPDAYLSEPDLEMMGQVIDVLKQAGNRVWVEAHSELAILNCQYILNITKNEAMERLDCSSLIHVLTDWQEKEIIHLLSNCQKHRQGGIWVFKKPRGEGKTIHMQSFFNAFNKRMFSHFRSAGYLNTDPWEMTDVSKPLIEELGLWSWLVERVLAEPSTKKGRFLPGHFDRMSSMGVCPVCLAEVESMAGCRKCQGTGLNQQVLALNLLGMPISNYLLLSLDQIAEKVCEQLPSSLNKKLEICHETGLGVYPGGKLTSELSQTQKWGLGVLRFLWEFEQPALIGLDEPLRGLDQKFVKVVMEQIFAAAKKESVIFFATTNRGFSPICAFEK